MHYIPPDSSYPTDEYKTKKLVLRKIPAGDYWIGDDITKDIVWSGRCAPNTRHSVHLPKNFYIAIFQTTNAQYKRIMNDSSKDDTIPKTDFSWNTIRGSAGSSATPTDSGSVLAQLNTKTKTMGFDLGAGFDLPTESMWEIAARAGVLTHFLWGDDPSGYKAYCWTNTEHPGSPVEVGQLKPNNWGLYDVNGNVWDVVRDTGNREVDLATISEQVADATKPYSSGNASECTRRGGGSCQYNAIGALANNNNYMLATKESAVKNSNYSNNASFRVAWFK